MADDGWTDLPVAGGEISDAPTTWADTGLAVKQAGEHGAAAIAAGARRATDDSEVPAARFINGFSESLQKSLRGLAEDDFKEMTPAAQERITASITDPAFYKHPLSASYLQSIGMAPMVAATVAGGMLAGPVGAALAGGAFNAGSVEDEIYAGIDKPDAELRKTNPWYANLRSTGMSEEDARQDLTDKAMGLKPLIAGAIGAIGGVAGVGGAASRVLTGKAASLTADAERGMAGRMLSTGTEAGVVGGGVSGGDAALVQQAEIDTGVRPEFDKEALAKATGTGFALGAVTAAPLGIVGGPKVPGAKARPKVEVLADPLTPDAAIKTALADRQPVTPEVTAAPEHQTIASETRPEPEIAKPVTPEPVEVVQAKANRPENQPEIDADLPPVTPEVTPKEEWTELPVAEAPVTPEEPRAPRILEAQDPEAIETARATQEAADAAAASGPAQDALIAKNQAERGTRKMGPEERARKEAKDTAAKTIFDKYNAEDRVYPKTDAERTDLRDWSSAILLEAKTAGIDVSKIKAAKSAAPHSVWLKEVYDLKKTLDKKATRKDAREDRDLHIGEFIGRQLALKDGDPSVMLQGRAEAGELTKKQVGNTDNVGAKVEPTVVRMDTDLAHQEREVSLATPEKDAVTTAVASSAKGDVRGIEAPTEKGPLGERAVAASEVKKVEITDAERAKYNTPGVKGEAVKAKVKAKRVLKDKVESQSMIKQIVAAHEEKVTPRVTEKSELSAEQKASNEAILSKMDDADRWLAANDKPKRSPSSGFMDTISELEKLVANIEKKRARYERDGRAKGIGGEKAPLGHIEERVAPSDQDAYHVWPKQKHTVGEALDAYGLSSDEMVGQSRFNNFLRSRVVELTPDIPVYVLSDEQMAANNTYWTNHFGHAPGGIYDHTAKHILINEREFNDRHGAHSVIVHEAAHAVTMGALEKSPTLRQIANVLREYTHQRTRELAEGLGIEYKKPYGVTNHKEFFAEFYGNPQFQKLLRMIPLTQEIRAVIERQLGPIDPHIKNVWQAMVDFVRRIFKAKPDEYTAFDAMLRLSQHAEGIRGAELKAGNSRLIKAREHEVAAPHPGAYADAVKHTVEQAITDLRHTVTRDASQEKYRTPSASLKLGTFDQIAQMADRFWGRDSNPVRKIADLIEMTRVSAQRILQKTEPVVARLMELERKYKGTGYWEKFTDLVHDETMSRVFADRPLDQQPHLGKDTLHGAQPKARHADLFARHAYLPQDLKDARLMAMKFFTEQQNQMALDNIRNRVLAALGIKDDAMAMRIHLNQTTDADRIALTPHILELIQDAKVLNKIEGPYFPLMRHGDWVSRGTYKITPPKNATQLAPNVFEFSGKDARADAMKWGGEHDLHATIKSVWVDKNTGERFFKETDPVTHEVTETRVTSSDTDAEQRFRVTLQDQHVEFHRTKKEAIAATNAMRQHGGFAKVKEPNRRRFQPGDRQADMLAGQLETLANAVERRSSGLSTNAKNEMARAFNEAAIKMLGSTRLQSSKLPRNYVQGASKDLVQNTWDYARATSGYLAKLQHAPELEASMKEMLKSVDSDYTHGTGLGRSTIAHEIESRINKNNGFTPDGPIAQAAQRLMTVSFLDKLFGPSQNIINATQVAMNTMPYLAGRHGIGATFGALRNAYNDISGLSIVAQGIKETIAKAKGQPENTNFIGTVKARLKDTNERWMIDYLVERGSIDPEAGLEVGKLMGSKEGITGKMDAALGYVEGIARAMPQAIETINRTSTALAAFRLEMRKNGGNREAAARYAQEAVNNTQFLYSATNRPPIMNHPLAKLSLQFKQYGQGMYHLLGQQIGKAIRNESPGDRAEAVKTLGMMAAIYAGMAGTLGLPTEPFKYLMLGAKAVGLTSTSWDDVEASYRATLAHHFGKAGGEVISRGLPRLLGIDISSRVGLDQLVGGFGSPASDKENDNWAYVAKSVAGAPPSMLADWIKGANKLAAGDVAGAAQLMVPNKMIADSIQAYQRVTEGKKAASGRQLQGPYTPYQAAARVMGFTPRADAEGGAAAAALRSKTTHETNIRNTLISAYTRAKGAGDRKVAEVRINKWNREHNAHPEAQITSHTLSSAATRVSKEQPGLTATKQNMYLKQEVERTYNR